MDCISTFLRSGVKGERTINLLEEEGDVVVVKGEASAQHHVEDDTAAPDINLGTCVEPENEHGSAPSPSSPAVRDD